MKKTDDYYSSLMEQIFFADGVWGVLRLFLVLLAIFVLAVGGTFFVEAAPLSSSTIWLFIQLLRYSIVPVAVMVNVLLLGALYIQDIYELEKYNDALRFLFAALFSVRYPRITVEDGKAIAPNGQINFLERIGGPGRLKILPGNAVLLESLEKPTRVLGHGSYFIPRFEKIKMIFDLKDQEKLTKVSATTKDGIVVYVGNIRFRYRIDTGLSDRKLSRRSYTNPYPFSEEAILKNVYGRSVGREGLTEWDHAVRSVINGAITGYINYHPVDAITAPRELGSDPREAIKKEINSQNVHARLSEIGTSLSWVDIGYFEIDQPDVDRKRREAWEAKWSGNAAVIRAQGEAERIAIQEQGRAEGQANLLTSIANSLKDANIDETDENLWNIILARTAQILEATTSIYQREDKKHIESEAKDER